MKLREPLHKLSLVTKNLKGTPTVSCIAEFISGCIRTFLICASSADRRDDRRVREVLIIRFRWIWIITRFPNIIDVKIRFRTQWPFQALVADVIRLYTIGIDARSAASLKCWYTLVVESTKISLAGWVVNYPPVAIVVAEIDVRFFLDQRIKPAVVYAKSD